MSAWVQGVVERTFRCSSIDNFAPGVVQAQVRVVIKQGHGVAVRVHAVLSCGFGDTGEKAATLLRKRLAAGKPCTARGKWLEPVQGSMDLVLRGCQDIHTDEPACAAVRDAEAA